MDPKKQLQDLIRYVKEKKWQDEQAGGIVTALTEKLVAALLPVFQSHSEAVSGGVTDAVANAIKGLKVDVPEMKAPEVHVTVPEIKLPAFPKIQVPTPKVSVNIPDIHVPAPVMPDFMRVGGEVIIANGLKQPVPVRMVNFKGEDVQFPMMGGGMGGGKTDFFTIVDIKGSTVSIIDQVEGALRVTGSLSVSTTPFATYYASDAVGSMNVVQYGGNTVPTSYSEVNAGFMRIVHAADVGVSVNIIGAIGSLAASLVDSSGVQYSGSNPLPITGPVVVSSITASVSANIVDSSGVAYSGSNPLPITGPVVVSSVTASVAASMVDSGGVQYSGSNPMPSYIASQPTTLDIRQVSGNIDSVSVIGTTAANIVDSSGVGYSGSNPLPMTGTVVVSSVTASVQAAMVDSSGVQYSGSNPIPITVVSGSLTSTKAQIGNSDGDYSNVNPLPITIVSGSPSTTSAALTRQTNPTAVAADYVPMAADDLGRQLIRPIQVRDLIATAYISVSNGTETTLLAAAGAGVFLDCITLTATNNSTAAVQVDIRDATAGNIVHTMYLPASTGPIGWSLPVPYPQGNANNNWTVDLPDITGTTVYFTALFSKEV